MKNTKKKKKYDHDETLFIFYSKTLNYILNDFSL